MRRSEQEYTEHPQTDMRIQEHRFIPQHDSAETGGLDIPLLTASSRLDVSTLNPEEPVKTTANGMVSHNSSSSLNYNSSI